MHKLMCFVPAAGHASQESDPAFNASVEQLAYMQQGSHSQLQQQAQQQIAHMQQVLQQVRSCS